MKKTNSYNLPKKYLSYSSISLWLKNKKLFRERYYLNKKPEETVFMGFGKKIAEVLETRDYKEYPSLKKVPYYPISEHPLRVEIEGIPILGYLDLFNLNTNTFAEIKTGIVHKTNGPPWSDLKVAKHEQLPFYSMLIKEMYGNVNSLVNLIWLETNFKTKKIEFEGNTLEAKGTELELTGKIEIFERDIEEWERKRQKDIIIKCAEEIHYDYEKYLAGIK